MEKIKTSKNEERKISIFVILLIFLFFWFVYFTIIILFLTLIQFNIDMQLIQITTPGTAILSAIVVFIGICKEKSMRENKKIKTSNIREKIMFILKPLLIFLGIWLLMFIGIIMFVAQAQRDVDMQLIQLIALVSAIVSAVATFDFMRIDKAEDEKIKNI